MNIEKLREEGRHANSPFTGAEVLKIKELSGDSVIDSIFDSLWIGYAAGLKKGRREGQKKR